MTGSPSNRNLPRKDKDLPGYWAVLFVRAVMQHPAGHDPSSPLLLFEKIYREIAPTFQTSAELEEQLSLAGFERCEVTDLSDIYRITTATRP